MEETSHIAAHRIYLYSLNISRVHVDLHGGCFLDSEILNIEIFFPSGAKLQNVLVKSII